MRAKAGAGKTFETENKVVYLSLVFACKTTTTKTSLGTMVVYCMINTLIPPNRFVRIV